jgi:hypothetical protein
VRGRGGGGEEGVVGLEFVQGGGGLGELECEFGVLADVELLEEFRDVAVFEGFLAI